MLDEILSWLSQRQPADHAQYYKELARKYPNFTPPATASRVHKHPTTPPPNVIRCGVRHVRRDTTPLVTQRGWRQNKNTWRGSYATKFGTWPGRIQKRGDIFYVTIRKPPPEMQAHRKWICFSKVSSSGWYSIHLHDNPINSDVSAVILYVERLLTEALSKR